jgi:transcriptional regulator with XRE-family HTH domain
MILTVEENMEIGSKIKELRLKLDLTQEELADRCELTKGFISQIENDLASPSIATLADMLNVLGTSLKDFFSDRKETQIVFDKSDFFISENGTGESTWLIPNSQKHEMEPILLELPPGGISNDRLPFEGEEFGYVLSGKIVIVIGDKEHEAKKGCAFYLDGASSHVLKNKTDKDATILWITTPSNF